MTAVFDDVDLVRDRTLVERYQAGDRSAFDDLYRRYFARLVRYCERRVHDRCEAEEVAQEAFVKALRALDGLAGERRFYPWLTVIASRLIVDRHRRAQRCEPVADVDAGAVDDASEAIVNRAEFVLLDAALERLNGRHREILNLRERHGWSYQEIADHMEVTHGTVEALLFRARKALRREYLALTDARLAALPVVGLILRRLRAFAARVDGATAQAVTQWAGSAAGVAMMTVAASGLAGLALDGPAETGPVTVRTAPAVVDHEDIRSEAVDPVPAVPPTGAPKSVSETTAQPRSPRPAPPVVITGAGEARDKAGPTRAEAGPAVAGIDPAGSVADVAQRTTQYVEFVKEIAP